MESIPNVGIDDQTRVPRPEELIAAIHDENFPVISPFHSTCPMYFSGLIMVRMRSHNPSRHIVLTISVALGSIHPAIHAGTDVGRVRKFRDGVYPVYVEQGPSISEPRKRGHGS
jgi:hypothetical protein